MLIVTQRRATSPVPGDFGAPLRPGKDAGKLAAGIVAGAAVLRRKAVPGITREIAEPGTLPKISAYPGKTTVASAAAFYWAASRPDYVNVESRRDGSNA
jgi:hypothetical protein